MLRSYFGIIILSFFILISKIGNVSASGEGTFNFPKGIGVMELFVHHDIDVYEGRSFRMCPVNPTKAPQHDPLIALTADELICWACTDVKVSSCDTPVAATYDGSGNLITPDYCIPALPHEHIGRNCTQIGACGAGNAIIDAATIFPDGSAGTAKYLGCGGDSCKPKMPFIVWKEDSKGYLWDPVPPVCIRGGFISITTLSGYLTDAVLASYVASGNIIQDSTLTYDDTDSDNNPSTPIEIYTGSWTNRDVQGKGKCSDAESGCNPASSAPIFSGPLKHKQKRFPHVPAFEDNARNNSGATICDSTTSKAIGITRRCYYNIFPLAVQKVIVDNPTWFSALSGPEQTFLSGVSTNPLPIPSNSPAFSAAIYQLRDLSLGSLSTELGLVPARHDLLYTMDPASCMYTPKFASGAIFPLIDRIKPTIEVSAVIGTGIFTPANTLLLKQEGTLTAGIPLMNTGSYLAGSGIISVTLVDSGSSTFTPQSDWEFYNGISGIISSSVTICRTKTHTGMILNTDCFISPSHEVAHVDLTPLPLVYNATGELLVPHPVKIDMAISDIMPDGIQVAGEYQIYVAVFDAAGNKNTGIAIFNVIPEGFDPSRTRLDKYNVASIETPGTTLYTITGSNDAVYGGATEVNAYANAIDIQTYKISIFDKYANPIYNWNLYDFGLTQTGIYLDQINKVGPSALFIYASGGILSNSGQTGTTNGNGALKFNILSYTPGRFLEQFEFKYRNWDRFGDESDPLIPYTFPADDNAVEGLFNHIFTGSVNLYTTKRIDLGTSNDVRMDFFTTSDTQNTTLTGFTVSRFLETIKSSNPLDFIITSTGTYGSGFTFATYYPFPSYLTGATGSFVPEQKGKLFSSDLKVEAYPYIILTFSGYTTQYYVSYDEIKFGSGIVYGTGKLNRIYIDGMTSAIGKTGYVNAKDIVGVSTADTRNAVHKNVALLLRNRDITAGGGIINRVKYLTGNVSSTGLTDMNDWDVLIIKGGNFTIGDDYVSGTNDFDSRNYYFNSGTTSLESISHKGIIVLKDDVTGSGGYIYIKPDVRFIGASLFADESIESTNYNGTPFTISNSARTFLLNKQLVIFGSVLSKNTVGGAVRADSAGKYTLPWKKTTTTLDDAVRYDLSFLRMDHFGFDPTSYMNRGHEEFIVILIDPRNVSNPLPGFLIK